MKIILYKISYVDKKTGDHEYISPSACNTDLLEMKKIAKRMKYEMSEYYDKVMIKAETYEFKNYDFIEI